MNNMNNMNNMNQEISKDFRKFAKSKLGVKDSDFESYNKIQGHIYASMTPYILEEREMRVTQN